MKFALPLLTLFLLLSLFLLAFPWRKEEEGVHFAVLLTLDEPFVHSFEVGDELIHGATKESLGRVEEIEISPAYEETENGVFVLPNKSRVLLVLTAKGVFEDGKIKVGGAPLLTGKRLSLHGRGAAEGVCLWVRRESAT